MHKVWVNVGNQILFWIDRSEQLCVVKNSQVSPHTAAAYVWHGNVQAYSLRFPAEFIQTPNASPPRPRPRPHASVFALICTFDCRQSRATDVCNTHYYECVQFFLGEINFGCTWNQKLSAFYWCMGLSTLTETWHVRCSYKLPFIKWVETIRNRNIISIDSKFTSKAPILIDTSINQYNGIIL